ncbi:MBL fold metallo-hydrolase [Elioraea tepidiphila]|uniref:MBL fold metallo-hydrolase n=1 Tax=Elioraea tepidiphila TaxID=457934 RepID=UPI0012EC4361|nr:MBL fold metallo-hydrolase [Elioraea tepidiphila]
MNRAVAAAALTARPSALWFGRASGRRDGPALRIVGKGYSTMIDRRSLLATAPLLAVSATATAAPPPAGTAAPGFHRIRVGEAEITALLDGGMRMPEANAPRFFRDYDEAVVRRLREHAYFVEGFLHQPVGVYLVNTGRNLVLIDAGGEHAFFPGTGRMREAFAASGYRPEQVDTVLLTHIHPEHALGLVDGDGGRAFPHAEVVVSAQDHGFWTDPAMESRVPQGQRFIQAGRRAIGPYADRIRTFDATREVEVVPGITTMPAIGHTPGHVSYRISSGAEQMLVWGDVTHQTVIQLANPRWRLGIDVDPEAAVESRLRTLDMLATDRVLVGGVHLPWPAFGRIVRQGEGYAFVPRPWQL